MPSHVSCGRGGYHSDLDRQSARSLQLLIAAGLEWVPAPYRASTETFLFGRGRQSLCCSKGPHYCWVLGKALKLHLTFSDSTLSGRGRGPCDFRWGQKFRLPMWSPLVLGRGMEGSVSPYCLVGMKIPANLLVLSEAISAGGWAPGTA